MKFLTSGESHGKGLTSILEGLPAGLEITEEYINNKLLRRQKGYGRGGRMLIETDKAEIFSGVRHGKTIGSPIALLIRNKDWENWQQVMSINPVDLTDNVIQEKMQEKQIDFVRPGHADLSGTIKYQHDDIRNVLERSSARETAARVALGAICSKFLEEFNIKIFSHITKINNAKLNTNSNNIDIEKAAITAENSPVRCIDKDTEQLMIHEIDNARESGDTLGGMIQIIASGLPIGLGSYVHWDRRLDAMIAQHIMSIPAIKSIEIGMGSNVAVEPGSLVHDEIFPADNAIKFKRKTNNAGGIEGGMSNGEPLVINAAMKPIPTLKKPLRSINLKTKEEHIAHYERSDVCAVPAAGVVCEAMLAIALTSAFIEKFGGDSIEELKTNYNNYIKTYSQD
ncbi:MAG: chorismate synthase [Vampirovibrionia bacterium]